MNQFRVVIILFILLLIGCEGDNSVELGRWSAGAGMPVSRS